MKTVIVGIAPARPGEEGQPLSAIAPRSTGRKISDMLEVSPLVYMRAFDRVNVCPNAQEGTIHPRSYAAHAENLAASLLRQRNVILLGQNVAECFGITRERYSYCEWKDSRIHESYGLVGWNTGRFPPFRWAVLPHPSGRNRWYNDPFNAETARQFLVAEYRRMIADATK